MNLSLSPEGPSSAEEKKKIRDALDKMLKASDEMGIENEQGKRMVEFNDKDKTLQATAAKVKQTCHGLLGQGKTQTVEWTENHCNNVLDSKEICQGLTLGKSTIEADLNNSNCNKFSFRKPTACSNLSALMKKNVLERKVRKCE